jgi:hypothetical protein
VLKGALHHTGAPIPNPDKLINPRATHADKRKLGGDKKSIKEHKDNDNKKAETRIDKIHYSSLLTTTMLQ